MKNAILFSVGLTASLIVGGMAHADGFSLNLNQGGASFAAQIGNGSSQQAPAPAPAVKKDTGQEQVADRPQSREYHGKSEERHNENDQRKASKKREKESKHNKRHD